MRPTQLERPPPVECGDGHPSSPRAQISRLILQHAEMFQFVMTWHGWWVDGCFVISAFPFGRLDGGKWFVTDPSLSSKGSRQIIAGSIYITTIRNGDLVFLFVFMAIPRIYGQLYLLKGSDRRCCKRVLRSGTIASY